MQGYIFWPFPPPEGEVFLSKLKNGEEFEGGLEKERKRGERRKQRKE